MPSFQNGRSDWCRLLRHAMPSGLTVSDPYMPYRVAAPVSAQVTCLLFSPGLWCRSLRVMPICLSVMHSLSLVSFSFDLQSDWCEQWCWLCHDFPNFEWLHRFHVSMWNDKPNSYLWAAWIPACLSHPCKSSEFEVYHINVAKSPSIAPEHLRKDQHSQVSFFAVTVLAISMHPDTRISWIWPLAK